MIERSTSRFTSRCLAIRSRSRFFSATRILLTSSRTASPSATFPPGVLSQSFFVPYDILWNSFISALRADATTSNDNTANASLPGSAFSTNIVASSANGRALGLNTPPAMRSDGTIGPGGPFDGIVTLNSAQTVLVHPASHQWQLRRAACGRA